MLFIQLASNKIFNPLFIFTVSTKSLYNFFLGFLGRMKKQFLNYISDYFIKI